MSAEKSDVLTVRDVDAFIGSRLFSLRKERGLTLGQMSDILDCGPQQLWKYENGVNSIRAKMLLDFAARLGVSYLYFVAIVGRDTYEEYQLVQAWRALGTRAKARVMAFVRGGAK